MLSESCSFSPSRAGLSAVLRDEYLTSAVRTKEGNKAGSNQPPARDPVQFTLELTPNYLISYLENTGSRSSRYVSMPTVGSSKPQPYPAQRCLFGRDTLIGGFESTRIPQMPLVEFCAPVMLRKLVFQLQDRFSREILEGLSSHSDGAWIHIYWIGSRYFRGKKLNSLASVPA